MNIKEVLRLATKKTKQTSMITRKCWDGVILYLGVNSLWVLNKNECYKLNFDDVLADDWELVE